MRTREYSASDEAFLNVSVPIAALEGLDDGMLGPEAVPLQLLDTPGPNEAGEESLRFQVGLVQALVGLHKWSNLLLHQLACLHIRA